MTSSGKTYPTEEDPYNIDNLSKTDVMDMDVNDTAIFVIYISGGAQQTDVHADSTASGMLIG